MKVLFVFFKVFKLVGVYGIVVEVWWGIVERIFFFVYDWFLYEELFKLIFEVGLKLYVVLCFYLNVRLLFY